MPDLPKAGTRIPTEKFHVSKCNVRYGVPFGLTEKDRQLEENLKFNKIKIPIHARPEEKGFGVYIGKGRLQARSKYTTHFTVGEEVLIFDISEEDARIASFIENNEFLKKSMDPITYAEQLNMIASRLGAGVRGTAKKLGITPSGLSEYLTMLEGLPSKKMREAIKSFHVPFKGKSSSDPHSALGIAKMKLPKDKLDELAEVLNTKGVQELWQQIDQLTTGKQKRGLPKDTYAIIRNTFDKRNKFDLQYYEGLEQLAKENNMKIDEYTKQVLVDHIKAHKKIK